MGLFSHKEKTSASGPGAEHYVVYGLVDGQQERFRAAFDTKFRSPQVSLSFSRPPLDVRSGYVAEGPDDKYLTITPRGPLSASDADRAGEAVRFAARQAGASSMCRVRS